MTQPAPLLAGKKGLVMGIANDRSLAWGVAKAARAQGAELAVTYQGDALRKRVAPLAEELGSASLVPADVTDPSSLDALFVGIQERWAASTSWFMRSPSPTRRSSKAATSIPARPIFSGR